MNENPKSCMKDRAIAFDRSQWFYLLTAIFFSIMFTLREERNRQHLFIIQTFNNFIKIFPMYFKY